MKSSSYDAIFDAETGSVRTTVNLDDTLLAEAKSFTGMEETSVLLRGALTALVEREASLRLARLGGSAPQVNWRLADDLDDPRRDIEIDINRCDL